MKKRITARQWMDPLLNLHGIFAIRKPIGPSSANCVSQIKSAIISTIPPNLHGRIESKIKIGHGGTLDPIAEGVLVIGINKGCKTISNYLKGDKEYIGTGRLGQESTTYDNTGIIVKESNDWNSITTDQINKLLQENFMGNILQKPPIFSAISIDGKRAYDIARHKEKTNPEELKTMSLPERSISIQHIELLSFTPPEFEIKVKCGSGTYIRSIIHDIGRILKVGALMTKLVRTKQGEFSLDKALEISDCHEIEKIKLSMISIDPQEIREAKKD